MNENKMMENFELPPKRGNKFENFLLFILFLVLAGAIGVHVTNFNPFISQMNRGTKIVGQITESKNEVKIKKFGEIIWSDNDGNIYENSQLMTGKNSSAQLKIDDQVVSVASNTIIEFKKKDSLNTLIDIQEGDIGVIGHTNKVSYTVNNQSVESKDKNSSFSLSTKGLGKNSGVSVKQAPPKPQIILPPLPVNTDLILISPNSGNIFEGTNNIVKFAWTGNEREAVTLEINKDSQFKATPLYRKKIRLPKHDLKLEAEGELYWRIWLGNNIDNAPRDSFIFKKPGEAKLRLQRAAVIDKNNIIEIQNSLDGDVFLEQSAENNFIKIEKRLKIEKKIQKQRIYYLGQKYLRLVDRANNILAGPTPFYISPDNEKARLSYIQNKNLLNVSWKDQLSQIPELFYLLTVSGKNTTKSIETISPSVEFELPTSGEYEAKLYAIEKGTKGLLLSTKKIQYKKIVAVAPVVNKPEKEKPAALKLKKEIIIK